MSPLLPRFEHRTEPVLPLPQFRARLMRSGGIALALAAGSLLVGMVGYRVFVGLSWIDSFLDASMLLGGMGPVHPPETFSGKLFAGFYALYCGLAVIATASILIAPIVHRMLHKFHVQEDAGS